MNESEDIEKKSIKTVTGKGANLREISKTAVCLANGRGGKILIGIPDDTDVPPPSQRIDRALPDMLAKIIRQNTINVGIQSIDIIRSSNNGEYIEVAIFPSLQTIASTSNGRYFIRVSDECKPVHPADLTRLVADKNAYIWELQTTKRVASRNVDAEKTDDFLKRIRLSDRVSKFVREKSDEELLEHYLLSKDGFLTNLGILWIGRREDRAGLLYAPTIQFIRFDEREEKINKLVLDDFSLNPLEMIDKICSLEDWKEGVEVPSGIFRTRVPNYEIEIVRELIANAVVHRLYTMQGDIFLNLFPDRLEVHSPGLLPLGVTPRNILHHSIHRNSHLAKVFYDLQLMEKEGSGFDRIYERLLTDGKKPPVVVEEIDRVKVTVFGRIFDHHALMLMDKVSREHTLRQKELISLGILAQNNAMTILDLTKALLLKNTDDTHAWLSGLLENKLVLSKGRTKGKEYFVNPELLRRSGYKGKTTLRNIEVHRLRELILADLKVYPKSSISEIHGRIGREIPLRKLRSELKRLVAGKSIVPVGARKSRKYHLPNS